MFGFFNIYKPKGITSHDVVYKLRKFFGVKKIGHGGTLDPSAEGVLPVAVGGATVLIDYLAQEKEYVANFQLGFTSKSYDTETELEKFSDNRICERDVDDVLQNFRGEITQKPPMFSSVKFKGRKLYELAREGKSVDVKERSINIYKIELIKFDEQTQMGELFINCSKGTYVRSIIHDMGQLLCVGAVMTDLKRTLSGGMRIQESVTLEDLALPDIADKNIISPDEILNFPSVNLTFEQYNKVKNGNPLLIRGSGGLIFLKYNGFIVALAEISDNFAKMKKVFNNNL